MIFIEKRFGNNCQSRLPLIYFKTECKKQISLYSRVLSGMLSQMLVLIVLSLLILGGCKTEQTQGRSEVSLNDYWKFCIDSTTIGLNEKWPEKGLPINLVRQVNVPHTWNIDPKIGEYMGVAWYERTINIHSSDKGKLHFIRFGAINHDATVWINGKKAGEHLGSGYTSFNIDISPYLMFDKPNRLVVQVDNSFSSKNLPFLNYFDWPMDGGIFREVKLITTGRPAIENVFVTPVFDIKDPSKAAILNVTLKLYQPSFNAKENIKLNVDITEENQPSSNQVASFSKDVVLQGDSLHFKLQVSNYKLWHFDEPNLYRISIHIENKEGITTDTYNSNFGFRKLNVENDKLFFNGEEVRLTGAEYMPGGDLHYGMAVTSEKLNDEMKKLKEVNCVITRAHWQQSEELLDWYDRNGILLQEEIPLWQRPSIFNDTLWDIAKKQISEMVSRDYNHPCIIAWGVGNEVWEIPDSVTELVKKLKKEYKKLDTTRILNYVSNTIHKRFDKDAAAFSDILMPNDYSGLWHLLPSEGGITEEMVPGLLKKYHTLMSGKPIIISEYGYPEPKFKGGDSARIAHMIKHTNYYAESPYVSGAIYFCLQDYRTHMGEGGQGIKKHRLHGVLDLNGNKKPSYYVLKKLSSPVIFSKIEKVGNGKLSITLTGKNFPSYTIRNYRLIATSTDKKATSVVIPELKPGQKIQIELEIPGKSGKLVIQRPRGFEVTDTIYSLK